MSDLNSQRPVRSPTEERAYFACRRSTTADAVHVTVSGELDIATVAHVDRALRRAWATSDVIVLDLRDLEFIDSCGGHLIVEADCRIRRAGGRLIVVRGRLGEVAWLFALLGIDSLLEVVDRPPAESAAAPVPAQATRPEVDRLRTLSQSAH